MARKRMFSKLIVMSDDFLDMPATARSLYYCLSMEADDDGFVNSPKGIMRQCGASADDMKVLIAKNFVIEFKPIVVITHWRVNNIIRKDRYIPTRYVKELNQLIVDADGAYTLKVDGIPNGYQMDTKWIPMVNQMEPQCSVDKVSVDKVSRVCKYQLDGEILFEDTYNTLVNKYGKDEVENQIKRILDRPYHGCLNGETIDKWCEEAKNRPTTHTQKKNQFLDFNQRKYGDDFEKMLLNTNPCS